MQLPPFDVLYLKSKVHDAIWTILHWLINIISLVNMIQPFKEGVGPIHMHVHVQL